MVHVSVPDDIDADYRVLAIAIQEGSGPCDLRVTLELNSIQAEYLARLQRSMNATLSNVQPGAASSLGMASSGTSSEPGTGAWANLNDLNDVVVTGTPDDNELMAYDSGSGNWINQTAIEAALTPATLTTKGDLLTWGTALDRLPLGTANGYVLTVGTAQATGLVWAMGSVTHFAHEYLATGGTANAYPVIYGTAGTVTLPTAGDNANRFYYIVNPGAGTVTASPTWGTTTAEIGPQAAAMFHSTGTAWAVI